MKARIETYEQGTGKLIDVQEIEVPDPPEPDLTEEERKNLRELIKHAKKMGWVKEK